MASDFSFRAIKAWWGLWFFHVSPRQCYDEEICRYHKTTNATPSSKASRNIKGKIEFAFYPIHHFSSCLRPAKIKLCAVKLKTNDLITPRVSLLPFCLCPGNFAALAHISRLSRIVSAAELRIRRLKINTSIFAPPYNSIAARMSSTGICNFLANLFNSPSVSVSGFFSRSDAVCAPLPMMAPNSSLLLPIAEPLSKTNIRLGVLSNLFSPYFPPRFDLIELSRQKNIIY